MYSGVTLVGRYMPLCASAAFCSREDPSVPLGAMPSPPGVTQPPRFYHIPEGVGRLDALEFRRPYPVFDIHHVADRLNEEQTLTLTHGLVCHGLPWGICSFGAGKIWEWVDDLTLQPLLQGAAFVAVTLERSLRYGAVEPYESKPWRDESISLELECHRGYGELGKPWIPWAHAIVAGDKGDVAQLLSGPSILFDDKHCNCVDWCVDGQLCRHGFPDLH